MTTTIRSFDGETMLHIDPESAGGHWVLAQREGESGWIGDSYRRAELLAALGAVSTADMAREIAEAQRGADEWRARAEEADLALKGRNEAQDRAEVARANAVALAAERDHWQARAEKAEATIAAVREHVEDDHIWWPKSAQREGLRKILDPKPAFTLPTEAGARFEATHKGTGTRNEFVTFTDGSNAVYVLHEGTYWVAEDVMNGFEGFRLLGADQ